MPDDRVRQVDEVERPREPRKVPPIGLLLGGLAAFVFVGGTLMSVLSAEEAEIEGEQPRPPLSSLMEETETVVRGTAQEITRLGQPRDAGVVATIRVEEVLSRRGSEAPEIRIFDTGFRESWIEGQEMVLFLAPGKDLPDGAEAEVLERCVLDEDALPCPYDLEVVRDYSGD